MSGVFIKASLIALITRCRGRAGRAGSITAARIYRSINTAEVRAQSFAVRICAVALRQIAGIMAG